MFSAAQIWSQINELYKKIASLPGKDYPPANIKQMIDQCKQADRADLGHKIMEQWNKVVDKYPASRVNWGAATKIGTASVKKNVFGGQDFVHWLEAESKSGVKVKPVAEPKVHVPAIAIPEDGETPEDWQHAAQKTKHILDEAEHAFKNADEFLSFLNQQCEDLSRKLKDYGKGGAKELTKKGIPHKFTERLPKWAAELEVYSSKVKEVEAKVKQASNKFSKAKNSYNHAPVTTVAYEQKAQESLQNVLQFILNIEDAKKQKEMLEKFSETIGKIEHNKAASVSRRAGIFDSIFEAVNHFVGWIKNAWHGLVEWVHGLFKAVDEFEEVAEKVGR